MLKTLLMTGGEGVAEPEWETKLSISPSAANSLFGYSVSISSDGSRVAIGARGNSSNQGTVYIYVRDGSDWTQEQKLLASDAAANDYFGQSVSISGDGTRVISGAYYKNSGAGSGQGAVYVFIRSGSTWTEEQKLLASDAAASDNFGWSVSISGSGSRVIVGADRKNSGFANQGAAYVFVRSGSTWTQEAKLLASDPGINNMFGYSVSISGDGSRVIVGAHIKNSGAGSGQGAAYIFSRSGTSWTEEQKLLISDAAANDQFGYSVSLSNDGSRVIVGADRKNSGAGANQGAAYIFVRSGSTWTQEQKLLASDPVEEDYFGTSVSLSSDGSLVVIGARGKNSGAGDSQGAAYVFRRTGSIWTEEVKLLASDASGNDSFGRSVSISGDGSIASVGASGKDTGRGAAYVYDFTLAPTP